MEFSSRSQTRVLEVGVTADIRVAVDGLLRRLSAAGLGIAQIASDAAVADYAELTRRVNHQAIMLP